LRRRRAVFAALDESQLAGMVHDVARPGDYVVLLGAGSITQWAYALPGELKPRRAQ
jgi:UDP-N-acetylmuramate--alanine ligase